MIAQPSAPVAPQPLPEEAAATPRPIDPESSAVTPDVSRPATESDRFVEPPISPPELDVTDVFPSPETQIPPEPTIQREQTETITRETETWQTDTPTPPTLPEIPVNQLPPSNDLPPTNSLPPANPLPGDSPDREPALDDSTDRAARRNSVAVMPPLPKDLDGLEAPSRAVATSTDVPNATIWDHTTKQVELPPIPSVVRPVSSRSHHKTARLSRGIEQRR